MSGDRARATARWGRQTRDAEPARGFGRNGVVLSAGARCHAGPLPPTVLSFPPPPSLPPPHCPTSSSSSRAPRAHCRLKDVEHSDGRLYLVFEWVDKDLKKYMDSLKNPDGSSSMGMPLIKVREEGGGDRRRTEGGSQQR